ncbi:VPLPA-CTERM sorting domain-containing protein [Rhodovulum euryhalinum]|uniref:Putative secreted protein n=1 Tax=Rhodovulum euryhalinum TaxID=35805 RepID=A0A4R2KEC8_9RHOB|nr:VPLPA-CTERM sorting domain-containing protein [Rhodovulum euryhalinum]TCO71961.1 putative secreted protein [Rhodovulum euryhalinum]
MKSVAIPLMLASLSCASAAQATTISLPQSGGTLNVTVSARAADAWAAVDQSRSGDLPAGSAWQAGSTIEQLPTTTYPIDLGTDPANPLDPCRNACSPFYGGVYNEPPFASTGAPGWETASFWTVFAPDAGSAALMNQAVLEFDTSRSSISLLWGSADNTNGLEFLLGGAVVGEFWGVEFSRFGTPDIVMHPGQSAVLTSFDGIEFDALRFTAYQSGGSFEFSNVVAPVPLPAGMVLLLTGLGAVAVAGRSRKARA